ncbi:MAG: leucine-rich repeat domain-containing protein [Candidatus Delongbacteria bacterium]|nr:leucine-rich repeat domain-containing protein [Candidatus Delongbacteria bacterium]
MLQLELAVTEGLAVVPVRVEDIKPTGGMAYYLSTVHWIEAVDSNIEQRINILKITVANILKCYKTAMDDEAKKVIPIDIEDDSYKNDNSSKINIIQLMVSKSNLIYAIIPATIALVVAFLLIFGTYIFKGNTEKTDIETFTQSPTVEQIESTKTITDAPAIQPTHIPTTTSTATVDPNVSLETIVQFESQELRACIINTFREMGLDFDGQTTVGDMQKLKTLQIISSYSIIMGYSEDIALCQINNSNIEKLEGLQYATNLETLTIVGQHLKDISALTQIQSLKYLDLSFNSISDITPIANNTDLRDLKFIKTKL